MDNEKKEDFDSTTGEPVIEKVEETQTDPATTEKEPEGKPMESLEDRKARLERQLDQTNKKLGLDTLKPEKKAAKTSNDLDYGAKAYLTANGIKGAQEFDFVQRELRASGEELDSLLENDYFKTRLEKFRSLNKTADATPTGKRSGGVPTDSVEYWMGKPIEEVPAEMRIKVVNAKLERDKVKGVFYNSN